MIKNLLLAIGTALATNTTTIQKNNESVFNNQNEIRELQPRKQYTSNVNYSGELKLYEDENQVSNIITAGGQIVATYYYNNKTPANSLQLAGANIKARATRNTQAIYSNGEIDSIYQRNFLMFSVNITNADFTLQTLKTVILNNIQNTASFFIEEMQIYYRNGNSEYTNRFLDGDTLTYNEMSTLFTTSGWQNGESSWIYSNNIERTQLITTEQYVYMIMYETQWDGITPTEQQFISATNGFFDKVAFTISMTQTNSNTNYEIIDVGGLFFTILGLPFAFISQAFNLTIFPGTPYAINISNLILTIIGLLSLVFILRKIIK